MQRMYLSHPDGTTFPLTMTFPNIASPNEQIASAARSFTRTSMESLAATS